MPDGNHHLPDELRQRFERYQAQTPVSAPPAPPDQVLRVADYARVSMAELVTKGHGMETQPYNTAQFIQREARWRHVASFSDPGVSGRHVRRKGLQALTKFIESDQIDILVVDRIDRLHRNLRNLLETVKLLKDHKVQLISIGEGIDFRDTWGQFILVMLGMLAEIYVEKLVRETSDGKHTRAMLKRLLNGRLPFGLCRGRCSVCTDPNGPDYCPRAGGPDLGDGRVAQWHPLEAPALREMFQLYGTGDYTDERLADALNARTHVLSDGRVLPWRPKSYPNERNPGCGRFTKDAVRKILMNEVYTGVVTYRGSGRRRKKPELERGQHAPLVDFEVWFHAQEIRKQRGHAPQGGTQRRRSRVYLLTERARCACGRKLKWNSTRSGAYGFCPARRDGTCHEPNIRVDVAHRQAGELFAHLSLPDTVRAEVARQVRDTDDYRAWETQLRDVERTFAQVKTAYAQGATDWPTLVAAERAYHRARGQLDSHPAPVAVPAEMLALLQTPGKLWCRLAPEDQRALIEIMIEVVEVRNAEVKEFRLYAPFAGWLASPPIERPHHSTTHDAHGMQGNQ